MTTLTLMTNTHENLIICFVFSSDVNVLFFTVASTVQALVTLGTYPFCQQALVAGKFAAVAHYSLLSLR